MEKGNKSGSLSSSFTVDLFGPKHSSTNSSSSSTSLIESIFGPPNSVPGRDTARSDFASTYGNTKHGLTDQMYEKSNMGAKMDKNVSYENGRIEPCSYNSSIYYGGQDVYSPATHNASPNHTFKKDGEGVDPNENNTNSAASRGNWWQGSLYY